MHIPNVSVIVPCYNLGDYVLEAVDSVLVQTYNDLEIIVVNDGSTDDRTNAVLRNLKRPRTIVLTSENKGLAAARNLAIQHSQGKYICALDADDKLHPQFLEKTIAVLDREPEIAFVSTWLEAFGTESWVWRQERCDFPALLAECVVLTASPVRREALDAVGGYDTRMADQGEEDWDLWISLVERGFSGVIIPEVLFYYRQRPASMRRTSAKPASRKRSWQYFLEKHRDAYLRFAPEVLQLKENECCGILMENWKLEGEIETLAARIAERRAMRDRLQAAVDRLPDVARFSQSLEHESDQVVPQDLQRAYAEIQALRASYSWKITAPVRSAYDGYLAIRRLFKSAPLNPK